MDNEITFFWAPGQDQPPRPSPKPKQGPWVGPQSSPWCCAVLGCPPCALEWVLRARKTYPETQSPPPTPQPMPPRPTKTSQTTPNRTNFCCNALWVVISPLVCAGGGWGGLGGERRVRGCLFPCFSHWLIKFMSLGIAVCRMPPSAHIGVVNIKKKDHLRQQGRKRWRLHIAW